MTGMDCSPSELNDTNAPFNSIRVFHAQYQPTDRPIEDRIAIARPRLASDPDHRTLAGVFDGHGGPHTSELLSQALLPEILESVPPQTPAEVVSEKLRLIFDAFDAKLLSNFTEHFKRSVKIPIQALRDNHISKQLCNNNVRSAVECAKSGSTALVAYVDGDILHLANTGDCRAVMGRIDEDGNASMLQLTEDLNTKNPLERARLASKSEEFTIVGERVLGQIGVTRSFGDAFFKLKNTDYTQYVFGHPAMTSKGKMSMHETHKHLYPHIISPPYLIPTPVVSTYTLTDKDRFLVLASDGLLDTAGVTHAWMVETVVRGLQTGQENIAEFLLDQAREVGRPGDDVSIIILLFRDKRQQIMNEY